MSKFFVGQRVRAVNAGPACTNPRALAMIGMTGRLKERMPLAGWWYVEMDVGDWDLEAREDALEPILDPGIESCDEEFKQSLDELLERQRESV